MKILPIRTPNSLTIGTVIGILLNVLAPFVVYSVVPHGAYQEDISILMLLALTVIAVPLFVLLLQRKGAMLWVTVCVMAALWPFVFLALPYADGVPVSDLVMQFLLNVRISAFFSALTGGIIWLLFYRNAPTD